jgi:hypothetical protein
MQLLKKNEMVVTMELKLRLYRGPSKTLSKEEIRWHNNRNRRERIK